jgi:alkyl sulfatase BDS1-like metallo-beta-lactamase superfamily hydrolase
VPDDVLTMADRLWRGELSTANLHPVDHLGGFVEITDGVGFTPSFANVSAFATDDGLVLVDTGSLPLAKVVHGDIRRWSPARLNTAVYSHGHIDHVFGVPVWEAEAEEQGWPAPQVIAHHALPARFDRYIFTAGYNTIINRRQFGFTDLNWPTSYRYPDRTYHDALELSVGGIDFSLRHEKGETDDHTITWQPDTKVLCCGDLFIWASPNAGNPQKVQRYPREWAQALRRMLALGAEFLLPGHGLPVVGADRVRQALSDTADLLDSLVDQTLQIMNAGGRLDDAIHSVLPPAELEARPYLRPVYDEPEFIVHTVWRQYGGWWDGNPATLKPAGERALATELAGLAGGPGVLADRALELLSVATESTDAGETDQALRLAGHLAEHAWLANPGDSAVQAARQQVFAARAARATSTMARGVFTWAANESTTGTAPHLH